MSGSWQAAAQSAAVQGFVTAVDNGEPLQGVNVVLEDAGGDIRGAISDRDGFFHISRIPPGRYQMRVSYIGFETYADTLDLDEGGRRQVDVALRVDALELGEVAVEAERLSGAARVTAGQQTIEPEDIELIPTPDISGDLVSYLSTMPGVVLMGDRGGQVFIRGGEPTHNMTLIDGMEIYQPFHVLGFYSAFPSEIIRRADVYASGFGSRYAGRISSVIDVQTRNGNKRRIGASASLSPFTSSGHLEGPLIRDRVSVMGAARVSMLDELASHYVDEPMPYAFSDVFGKVHALIGKNHHLSASLLQTHDRGSLTPEDDIFQRQDVIEWRNTVYGLRYLVTPRAFPIKGEAILSFSRLESERGTRGAPERSSEIQTVNTAVNMTNYAGGTQVNWGFYFLNTDLDAQVDGLFQDSLQRHGLVTHAGFYLEPDLYLGRGVYLRPGVNMQLYDTDGGFIAPRLRVRWERGRHHWSAAAGLYRQRLLGLTDRRDAANIFAAWVEPPFNQTPQALHLLLGYRVTPMPWLEASVEGFYKKMDDLFINEWTAFPGFTTRLQEASGRAMGLDLRLEVRGQRFYGFVNYGLSFTRYETQPQTDAVADPVSYRPPHDRRHQVNMLASTTMYGFELSVRWQYGSGLPYTQIKGFDGFILMDGAINVEEARGFPRVIYDSVPYRATLPHYHRLDVNVERTFTPFAGVGVTVQVGVINAYDRANLYALDLFTAQRTDQLPLVPIAGLKIEM